MPEGLRPEDIQFDASEASSPVKSLSRIEHDRAMLGITLPVFDRHCLTRAKETYFEDQ